MKKKWLISSFVFAFSMTLSGMIFADDIGQSGTCADSASSDGYEWCNAHLHVGDGSGPKDDYDMYWDIYWKATDSNTAYFDYYYYTQTGMSSGNDDVFEPQIFTGNITRSNASCEDAKVISGCNADYHFSMDENSNANIKAHTSIYDYENHDTYNLDFFIKPTT